MDITTMASYLDVLYTEPTIYFLLVWVIFWRGLGLWHAGKNRQKSWFIALFVLNTIGILPIIYLFFFSKTPLMKQCREIFGRKGKKPKKKVQRKKKR